MGSPPLKHSLPVLPTWKADVAMQKSLVDLGEQDFTDQCFEGYQLELNSSEFKNKLKSEKEKIKSQYKRLKKAIKVMLYFCDSFPSSVTPSESCI